MKQKAIQLSHEEIEAHMATIESKDLHLIKQVCEKLHVPIHDFFNIKSDYHISEARKVVAYIFKSQYYYHSKIAAIIRAKKMADTNSLYLCTQSIAHYNLYPDFRNLVDSFVITYPRIIALSYKPR